MKAYCMKCKKTIEIENAKQVKTRNGRKGFKGTCPVCGTKVFRIGG